MKLIGTFLLVFVSILAPAEVIAQSSTGQTSQTVPAQQAPDTTAAAPFGLTWGATKAETEKSGIALKELADQTNGPAYSATNLSKTISDAESVALFFGFSGRLYKIVAVGRTFENDPYGNAVRSRYDELVNVLQQKYGPGKASDYAADFYRNENWTYGLMKKENWHYTEFNSAGVSIEISCRSVSMSDPYWLIIYENIAESKVAEEARKKHEAGAL